MDTIRRVGRSTHLLACPCAGVKLLQPLLRQVIGTPQVGFDHKQQRDSHAGLDSGVQPAGDSATLRSEGVCRDRSRPFRQMLWMAQCRRSLDAKCASVHVVTACELLNSRAFDLLKAYAYTLTRCQCSSAFDSTVHRLIGPTSTFSKRHRFIFCNHNCGELGYIRPFPAVFRLNPELRAFIWESQKLTVGVRLEKRLLQNQTRKKM